MANYSNTAYSNNDSVSDVYLRNILQSYFVPTDIHSPVLRIANEIKPVINEWAGSLLQSIDTSGSFAKGTAVKGSTDIDFFISLDLPPQI